MAAIHLLHELELENRLATPEEQEVLARYVGWGGLSMAFDENNAAWAEEFKELNASLSPEEYRAAMESTLTAFYTPPVVIKAMYEALDHMGFSGGTILEPSCGTGNFFGLIPDGMAGSTLHGVEIDSLTGRIAKQLYQKASIAIEGFEQTKLPDDHFDVVVGNVPFGDFKVNDSRYNAQKFLIHDYFFAKALDKVRSGGVVAFITSKGTMDKTSPEVRKYIAQKPYSMPKKPRQRRQSRKQSNRHFRIGSGKTRHAGADWCGITTTRSIPSVPVSMMEAILYLAVSVQRLRSDLTRSMPLPISCMAATHSLPTRWAQERPLKWLLRHRRASALD